MGVSGGTFLELTGGKFANGAGRAVFAQLFNHMSEGKELDASCDVACEMVRKTKGKQATVDKAGEAMSTVGDITPELFFLAAPAARIGAGAAKAGKVLRPSET